MTLKTTCFYFLRHGELSVASCLAGHTDLSLSAMGLRQMHLTTAELVVDRCITSPLQRCAVFAEEYAAEKSIKLEYSPAIKEMDFGDWDGVHFDTLWQMPKPNIGDFWASPEKVPPPNGEQYSGFATRIEQWWRSQLTVQKNERVLVVTHAGVIKHLIGLVMNMQHLSSVQSCLSIKYGSLICIKVVHDDDQSVWTSLVI